MGRYSRSPDRQSQKVEAKERELESELVFEE